MPAAVELASGRPITVQRPVTKIEMTDNEDTSAFLICTSLGLRVR